MPWSSFALPLTKPLKIPPARPRSYPKSETIAEWTAATPPRSIRPSSLPTTQSFLCVKYYFYPFFPSSCLLELNHPQPPGSRLSFENPWSDTPLVRVGKNWFHPWERCVHISFFLFSFSFSFSFFSLYIFHLYLSLPLLHHILSILFLHSTIMELLVTALRRQWYVCVFLLVKNFTNFRGWCAFVDVVQRSSAWCVGKRF